MQRSLGYQVAGLGLIAAMLGLGLDVWLHADGGAALANEEIFAFTNPGHVLFGGGLLLTIGGVVLGLVGPEMMRPMPSRLMAGVVVLISGVVLAYGFTTPSQHSHADEHAAMEDGHAAAAAIDEALLQGLSQEELFLVEASRHEQGHDEHDANSLVLSAEALAKLGEEAAIARQTGARYASIETALAEGYVQIVQDLPLIGGHFIKPQYSSDGGRIDFSKPEMLIYTFQEGVWKLYGLSYLTRGVGFEREVAPEGFTGPFDMWHWHKDWCFTLEGARGVSPEECGDRGGIFIERTGYMVHFWLVDNPRGLFAHSHPGLVGSTEYITPSLDSAGRPLRGQ